MSERAGRQLGTGDLDEFRRAGHALVAGLADHLAGLPERPVWQPLPDELRAELLSLPLPEDATGLGPLVETMAARRAAVPDGERAPGLLRLGQPAAVARRACSPRWPRPR